MRWPFRRQATAGISPKFTMGELVGTRPDHLMGYVRGITVYGEVPWNFPSGPTPGRRTREAHATYVVQLVNGDVIEFDELELEKL